MLKDLSSVFSSLPSLNKKDFKIDGGETQWMHAVAVAANLDIRLSCKQGPCCKDRRTSQKKKQLKNFHLKKNFQLNNFHASKDRAARTGG